jgi:hypothetical protein
MRRCLGLLSCSVAIGVMAITAAPAASLAEVGSPVSCAGATATTTTTLPGAPTSTTTTSVNPGTTPPPGDSCWVDVQPYPFGSAGGPTEASSNPICFGLRNPGESCYLTVTSMAFRAWNRGLAATTELGGGSNQPYGVWLFNGSRWYPDPTFPGSKACKGNTVVWAGKLDYWLVGPGEDNWPSLCRFDGANFEWEPLEVPRATKEHVASGVEFANGQEILKLKPGGVTSAACFAWNDCWFFGTYGAVMHWNGKVLTDASPELWQGWLQGEYTGAAARQGPAGEPFGVAVSASSQQSQLAPLPAQPEGAPPPQIYGSSGEAFSPLPFTLPTSPQPSDPYRTDPVAVDLDSGGQGWVADNPGGLRLNEREGREPPQQDPQQPVTRQVSSHLPQPSPLVPLSTSGEAAGCAGPPVTRFAYTPFLAETPPEGSFLWSSITVIPSTGEALAGGHMRRATPGSGPNEDAAVGEPVITQAGCEGTTTVTRFRIPDPTSHGSTAPADRKGGVTAIAANATNDAWAATSRGELSPEVDEPPHLYRLTNGQAAEAPEGDDTEERPPELTIDHPTVFLNPPPPPEVEEELPAVAEAPPFVFTPLAATYEVKARVHTTKRNGHVYLSLYLSFKLRRAVTIGAQALVRGHVVSVARPRHFTGRTGLLILNLDRKHWPSKVRFIA